MISTKPAFDAGGLLALTIAPGVGLGTRLVGRLVNCASRRRAPPTSSAASRPPCVRVGWCGGASRRCLSTLVVRLTKCWHIAAVQRLLTGGWRMDPARAWAQLHDLPTDRLPVTAPVDLFTEPDDGDPDEPLRADGYLKPEWLAPDFEWTTGRLARWATLAIDVANLQDRRLELLDDRPMARSVARSESAAELLVCGTRPRRPSHGSRRGRVDRRIVRRSTSIERGRGGRTTQGARRRSVAPRDEPAAAIFETPHR